MAQKIHIGTITQAHGVKGLVKLLPHDDLALFENIIDADGHPVSITLKNKLGKYILAAIEGIDDRDAAQSIKGTKLYIDESALPDDDLRLLIGMDVIENDAVIGTLESIENYGAGNLFNVTLKSGEDILIPDHENYIISIDSAIIVQNHTDLKF